MAVLIYIDDSIDVVVVLIVILVDDIVDFQFDLPASRNGLIF